MRSERLRRVMIYLARKRVRQVEFIQYSKWKYDHIVAGVLLAVATLFIMCMSIVQRNWKTGVLLTVITLPALLGLYWNWRSEKQNIIRIDETGIRLTRKGKPVWAFAWEEIQRMGYCFQMNHKGVFFVPKEKPMRMDVWIVLSPSNHTFHLSKTAKEALARYCPLQIDK